MKKLIPLLLSLLVGILVLSQSSFAQNWQKEDIERLSNVGNGSLKIELRGEDTIVVSLTGNKVNKITEKNLSTGKAPLRFDEMGNSSCEPNEPTEGQKTQDAFYFLVKELEERLSEMKEAGITDDPQADKLFDKIVSFAKTMDWGDYKTTSSISDAPYALAQIGYYYGKQYGFKILELLTELTAEFPESEIHVALRVAVHHLLTLAPSSSIGVPTTEERRTLLEKLLELYKNYPSAYLPLDSYHGGEALARIVAPDVLEKIYAVRNEQEVALREKETLNRSSAYSPIENVSFHDPRYDFPISGLTQKEAFKALVESLRSSVWYQENNSASWTLLSEIEKILNRARPRPDGSLPFDKSEVERIAWTAAYGKQYGWRIVRMLEDLMRKYPQDGTLRDVYQESIRRMITSADARGIEIPTRAERRELGEKLYTLYLYYPDDSVSSGSAEAILQVVAPDLVKRLLDLKKTRENEKK